MTEISASGFIMLNSGFMRLSIAPRGQIAYIGSQDFLQLF